LKERQFALEQYDLADVRPNPKKNMGIRDPMPELTITSPYVHSRVDSITFTIGNPYARVDLNPMPESDLTLCQSRLYIPQAETLDLASGDFLLYNYVPIF
jgi:hypothetical protein